MFTASLLQQAVGILRDFYDRATTISPPFPLDELEERLIGLGAADDSDLAGLRWEDLERIGILHLQAQRIAEVFRGESVGESQTQYTVVRTMTDEVSELPNRDLAQRFAKNPTVLHGAVAEQMRARSRGKPCIVLLSEGGIDVDGTARALEGIGLGEEYGETIRISGKPRRLYLLEEANNPIRMVHPVFPGKTLLLDGTDHHGVYWGDIPEDCQQLICLARETSELKVCDREDLCNLRDRAANGGMTSLAERYPRAFLLYEERRELRSLPALRTRLKTARVVKAAS